MTDCSLTLACNDYEWFEPLITGHVELEGADLDIQTAMAGGERHRRMIADEFDIAEFSLGTYITGWPDCEFTAIPAFPRRFFPHSRTFVRRDTDLTSPADLEGKRVLIWTYQNTLALWAKGIYAEHYGLDLEQVQWRALRPEPISVDLPIEIEQVDSDVAPRALLERGAVDAVIIPYTGPMYTPEADVRRLFEDLESAERTYYEDTGFYPLMHTVVIRNDVIDDNRWLPTELLKTFRQSVAVFEERARYEAKYPLVWWQSYREREHDQFGDIWGQSFEFNANADELQAMIRYAHQQGLIDEQFEPEEMFVRADQHL